MWFWSNAGTNTFLLCFFYVANKYIISLYNINIIFNYLGINYCTINYALLFQLSIITWLILSIYFSHLYFSFSCEESTQHSGDPRPLQLQQSRFNKFYWLAVQQNICRLYKNWRRGINLTIWSIFYLINV